MTGLSLSRPVPPQYIAFKRELRELQSQTCGACRHFRPEFVIDKRRAGACLKSFATIVRDTDRQPCGKFDRDLT